MFGSKGLNEYCEVIDTYNGRDKVMKALCHSANLIAGYHLNRNPELSKRFAIASSHISSARATLSLIDDIPTIRDTLEYGFGDSESDGWIALLGVTANIFDLIYIPIEKICWLTGRNIVNFKNSETWEFLRSIVGIITIYLNLMRTLRSFNLNQQKIDKANYNASRIPLDDIVLKKHRLEVLSLIRLSLDLTREVSILPSGYLWGGKLSTLQAGLIGTLSAAIDIYQIFANRNLK